MSFTSAQIAVLKAAIAAQTDPTFVANRQAGATNAMADFFNTPSTSVVWRSTTSGDALRNAILWANMTPSQPPDGTAVWTNKALYSQAKQISLQTMVQGAQLVASGVAGIRAGLQDCLTALPTSSTGTNQAAGWAAVQVVMQRFATVAEALFDSGTGTAQAPADLGWEGFVTGSDIVLALGS